MPQTLTLAEIEQYQTQIKQGGINAVLQVYDSLYESGYNYAGWAVGVARGDSISGQAALQFMQSTSAMGTSGEAGQNLNPLQVDALRVDMALGYLQALGAKAADLGGSVNEDLNFSAIKEFHRTAFEPYGLTLANWTLTTPMDLIERTEGPQAVEELWARIRDTGGDGPDSVIMNMILAQRVGNLAFHPDPSISGPAQQWMDLTPGVANFAQWGRTLGVAWDALIEATAVTIVDGDIQTKYYANGVQVETSTHIYDSIEYGVILVGSDSVQYSIRITSPSGVVQYIGKSGTVTSINGQVTHYEAIQANGDQTIKEFDSNGNTVKLIEIDGAHNHADYATRTINYDIQGRHVSTEVTMDDGSRSVYEYTEPDSFVPWSALEWHYDAEGCNDSFEMTMGDGSRVAYLYDVSDRESWSTIQTHIDTEGRNFATYVFMDDGSLDEYIDDVNSIYSWSSSYRHFDSETRLEFAEFTGDDGSRTVQVYDKGREDWREIFYADGSRDWIDFDQNSEREDSVLKIHYDAAGREDWNEIINHNGSREWIDFDQNNEREDSVLKIHYNAAGLEDWRSVTLNDGSRDLYVFDPYGWQAWSSTYTKFDASGREDYSVIYRDDGSRQVTDYDQDGSRDWIQVVTNFDAQGREDWIKTTYNNGESIYVDYDQDGSKDWSRIEIHYDIDGLQTTSFKQFDTGEWVTL